MMAGGQSINMETRVMKNLTLLIMSLITIASNATWASYELQQIPISMVTGLEKVMALETIDGRMLSTKKIVSLPTIDRKFAAKILNLPQIEFKNGSIVYPEEISSLYKLVKSPIAKVPRDEDEKKALGFVSRAPRDEEE